MRRLIFGLLLVPLFVGLLVALLGSIHVIKGRGEFGDFGLGAAVASAGALALITAFLLDRHSGGQFTFHWLYVLGLICLCSSLAQVLQEIGRENPWDPYNFVGYQVLSRVLCAVSTLVVGLACLITAVLQDLFSIGRSKA